MAGPRSEPRQLGVVLPLQVEASLAQGGRVHTIMVKTLGRGYFLVWTRGLLENHAKAVLAKTWLCRSATWVQIQL